MAKQIKLLGAHLGATMAFGALQFHKGLSQPMSQRDAEIHQETLHAVDANAGVQVEEGEERPPFAQVYFTDIVDVAPTPIEASAPTTEADPHPAPDEGEGE